MARINKEARIKLNLPLIMKFPCIFRHSDRLPSFIQVAESIKKDYSNTKLINLTVEIPLDNERHSFLGEATIKVI